MWRGTGTSYGNVSSRENWSPCSTITKHWRLTLPFSKAYSKVSTFYLNHAQIQKTRVSPLPHPPLKNYKILVVNYQKQFLHPLKTILFSLSQPLEKFCGSAHVNTLSSNNGLNDEQIMMSTRFLAANKDQEFDQLKLALAWNRIDIAKSEIFTEDKIWPVLTLLIIASIIYVPIKKNPIR